MTDKVPYKSPETISRFRSGDEEAFTIIYDHTYSSIFQYARRWLNDSQEAQDVTADTFIKLLDRRTQFLNYDNIFSFLKVTVRNNCLNILKHYKVQTDKQKDIFYQLSQEQEPDLSWVQAQEHYLSLIYEEVEKLPGKMKEIFLLAYKDGLKSSEIAERLNIKVRTVTNQKLNAINLLKDALAQHPLVVAWILLLQEEILSYYT